MNYFTSENMSQYRANWEAKHQQSAIFDEEIYCRLQDEREALVDELVAYDLADHKRDAYWITFVLREGFGGYWHMTLDELRAEADERNIIVRI